jgi:hypothetical protein
MLAIGMTVGDFDGLPLSLHSNHVDSNLGSINGFVRRAGIRQIAVELILARYWAMTVGRDLRWLGSGGKLHSGLGSPAATVR